MVIDTNKNNKQFSFLIDEKISSTQIKKFCDLYEINYEEKL